MEKAIPVYLRTLREGKFPEKIARVRELARQCQVCPRHCGVNRLAGEHGECRVGYNPIISSYFPHFGEETPLVGWQGSGTIFIGGCNLLCLFCQNYDTSHLLVGRTVSIPQFAEIMLKLQRLGCHNINIVTPSHIVPALIEALYLAAQDGLEIPLVYNSGGYDSPDSLQLLDGLIDVYMPDFKFFDDALGAKYTAVDNYGTIARQAIKEMHRQVGDLVIENGLARQGLLVRHLVMPGMLEDSRHIFEFLAREISPHTYLNVMPQYRPAGEAYNYEEIHRSLHYSEFIQAISLAKAAGLYRLDKE